MCEVAMFNPPLYVQRYEAVLRIIERYHKEGMEVTKVREGVSISNLIVMFVCLSYPNCFTRS